MSAASTVKGYTIPEVRKCLDTIRRSWGNRNNGKFSFFTMVSEKDSIGSFSLKFMLSHHRKRHARRLRKVP
jgi:hypothetical protein